MSKFIENRKNSSYSHHHLQTIESSCASAIDVAAPVSLDAFKCMKNHGYSTAFVRHGRRVKEGQSLLKENIQKIGFRGYAMGKFDTNVINNIRNADLCRLAIM